MREQSDIFSYFLGSIQLSVLEFFPLQLSSISDHNCRKSILGNLVVVSLACIAFMCKKSEPPLIKHWLSRVNEMKNLEWREFMKEDASFRLWLK